MYNIFRNPNNTTPERIINLTKIVMNDFLSIETYLYIPINSDLIEY